MFLLAECGRPEGMHEGVGDFSTELVGEGLVEQRSAIHGAYGDQGAV